MSVDGGDQGTAETAIIDINNGGFPGIKFNVMAFFELGTLIIEGTPGKDVISVGRGPLVGAIEKGGVDLDGDLTADVSFCLEPASCDTTGYIDSGIQSVVVNGHGGDDVLTAAGGGTVDQLSGSIIDEFVTLDGGEGHDVLDMSKSPQFAEANLLAGYATGAIIVRSIEDVIGTRFRDDLTGDDKANTIVGGSGDDVINGLGADDV